MSEEKQNKTEKTQDLNLEEMVQAGIHLGHRVSRIHPKMKPYIYGVKNYTHIIDLEKAAAKLSEALEFIKNLIVEGKVLILVGTKIQVKEMIKEIGEQFQLPYISERWLGGTLTNFEEMQRRINYFRDLEQKKNEGYFEKYTKKEKAKIDEELADLERKFGGLKNLKALPDAIFVCDVNKDKVACREARAKGVKILGVISTNSDPAIADFVIPANDNAITAQKYILEKVRKAIEDGKSKPKSQ